MARHDAGATASLVPVFPCLSLDDTLTFYTALGFEVTHDQREPYVYGAVRWGRVEVHVHGKRQRAAPADGAGTCLVLVDGVGDPHRAFVEGLRAAYGTLPTAGYPRITRLRTGQTRFALFDPSGNTLVFIARDEPPHTYEEPEAGRSKLAEALDTAVWLRDLRGFDDVAAARVLDKALARDAPAPAIDRARVLAARAELAVALGEPDRARELRDELALVELTSEERERYREELEAADALERLIAPAD